MSWTQSDATSAATHGANEKNVTELRQSRQEFLEETRGHHPGMTPADLSCLGLSPHPPLLLPLWLSPTPALCGADCGIRGLQAFKQEKWLLHMLPEECCPPDAPESPPSPRVQESRHLWKSPQVSESIFSRGVKPVTAGGSVCRAAAATLSCVDLVLSSLFTHV